MQASTLEILRDILHEAEFLTAQASQISFTSFVADEVKKRAFVHSIEIVGEAAKEDPGGNTQSDSRDRVEEDRRHEGSAHS